MLHTYFLLSNNLLTPGGSTWQTRTFNNLDEDEEITYRFEIASLSEDEGWIVGM